MTMEVLSIILLVMKGSKMNEGVLPSYPLKEWCCDKMTNSLILKGITVLEEDSTIENGYIRIEKGIITSIGECSDLLDEKGLEIYDFSNFQPSYTAVLGFIDLHIHGVNGSDTMDASLDAMKNMCNSLPREGTTAFLPTTLTQSEDAINRALKSVAEYKKEQMIDGSGEAEICGIHLEGPFILPSKAGAQPVQYIMLPSEETFQRWQETAEGMIKLVTMAPEVEGGMDFVQKISSKGVVVSLGHTDATFQEVERAVEHGASQVTHLYNQMRGLHHREPGVVGAALTLNELKAEIICDEIHIHPQVVKATFLAKGVNGLLLITDSMRGKGLEDGTYDFGRQEVTVTCDTVLLSDGTLAGSVVGMDEAVRNVMKFTGCTLRDAIQMASTNPARQIGVFDRKGSLKVGKDADIVILDNEHNVIMTFCKGKLARRYPDS